MKEIIKISLIGAAIHFGAMILTLQMPSMALLQFGLGMLNLVWAFYGSDICEPFEKKRGKK